MIKQKLNLIKHEIGNLIMAMMKGGILEGEKRIRMRGIFKLIAFPLPDIIGHVYLQTALFGVGIKKDYFSGFICFIFGLN